MHIGLIGLGRMGNNMRARLEKNDIEVTGYDTNPEVSDVATLADLVAALPAPRTVWVMVPAGEITDNVIRDLEPLLEKGDLVIDGGNSRFTEDTPSCSPPRASTSWTPASPAASGASRTATA